MDHKLPKAILFDLDDTILEFEKPETGWLRACNRYAPLLGDVNPELLVGAIIDRRDWYWDDPKRHRAGRFDLGMASRQIVRAAFELLDIGKLHIADEVADLYRYERDGAERPVVGAIDTLRRLIELDIKLALITNGGADAQRDKVERHGLAPFFDNILIEGEFGIGKPHPQVYIHSLEQLGAMPQDTWMAGDNLEWEVEAPQKLGIYSIWIDPSGDGLPKDAGVRPDRIIRSVTELL